MKRQAQGAVIAVLFVAAFITAIAFHSVIAAVIVVLSGITVAYVIGIAWMRTAPDRMHGKRDDQHSLP
jgi:hypothetical protein